MSTATATSLHPRVEPAESTPSAGSTPAVTSAGASIGTLTGTSIGTSAGTSIGASTGGAALHVVDFQRVTAGKSRLASLRSAGLVRRASERVDTGIERTLPVAAALRPLLPGGCLRRGSTVVVAPGSHITGSHINGNGQTAMGATSLLFALLAETSATGSWCAVVGLPRLGLVAAAEAGVAVERLALIPRPGPDWVDTVGALLDGLDVVVVATPAGVPPALATRLAAKTRQRGGVLIPVGTWPGADLILEVEGSSWHGLGTGLGRLRRRSVEVVAYGRGAAARPRRAALWLPGPHGAVGGVDSLAHLDPMRDHHSQILEKSA